MSVQREEILRFGQWIGFPKWRITERKRKETQTESDSFKEIRKKGTRRVIQRSHREQA